MHIRSRWEPPTGRSIGGSRRNGSTSCAVVARSLAARCALGVQVWAPLGIVLVMELRWYTAHSHVVRMGRQLEQATMQMRGRRGSWPTGTENGCGSAMPRSAATAQIAVGSAPALRLAPPASDGTTALCMRERGRRFPRHCFENIAMPVLVRVTSALRKRSVL